MFQSITYLLLLAVGCALAWHGAWLSLGRHRSASGGLTWGLPGAAAGGLAVMLGIGTSPIHTPAPVIARSAEKTAHRPALSRPALSERAVLLEISACESHGNKRAISKDRMYRGKYQFDAGTWRSETA